MIVVLSGLVAIVCGSHCCLLRKMSRVIVFQSLCPLLVDAMIQRDSVLLHCYSWYSRLQYQGTRSCCAVTAGTVGCSTKGLCHCTLTAATVGCSTKGLGLAALLQLVH